MTIRTELIFLAGLLLAGLADSAAARSSTSSIEPLRVYDEENPAPDHIYFRHFLQGLFDSDTDSESRDSDAEVHEVLHGIGLSHSLEDENRARRMHNVLRKSHMQISRDIRRAEHRMLCEWRDDNWTEDDLYQQMDKLSEIRDRIAEKHYLNTLTTIEGKLAAALDLALQQGKSGFVSVRYPHKAMYEGSSLNVTNRVEALCRRDTP